MSFFYSSVPLADPKKCPQTEQHNRLAKEVNLRIESAGPASAWSIFYYADSIFTGMRNTATPGQPLGVNPPEDEWWKVYAHIDLPTAQTGEGNWPLTGAGMPQGANVMNPVNAYIFGRVTYENKLFENRMGPWAEGNLFDGLVQSSRAVLSNSNYWEDSFRQRGAYKVNLNYFNEIGGSRASWRKHSKYKYLPSPFDKVYISKSLASAGRSSDHFFPEYASQHVYARYAPRESGNKIIRKNAAKDVLKWMLWAYTYYFRGSEQQRSLFCEAKSWDTPLLDFETTGEYQGQQTYGMKRTRSFGSLSVCDVGFDFFSYMTRQNILAPVLAAKQPASPVRKSIDSTGNIKLEQYRPEFKLEIKQGDVDNNFLGTVNGEQININYRNLSSINKTQTQDNSTNRRKKVIGFENYDEVDETGQVYNVPRYGKTLRFAGDADQDDEGRTVYNETMLLKCSYDNMSPGGMSVGSKVLPLASLASTYKATGDRFLDPLFTAPHCLAGYYIETNAVENPEMAFKVRIWGSRDLNEQVVNDDGYLDNTSVPVLLHETIIWKKNSYTVNRRGLSGGKGYVYNKIFYFKKPITGSFYNASAGTGTINEKVRFEIAPVYKDELRQLTSSDKAAKKNDSPVAMAVYNARIEKQEEKYPDDSSKHLDRVISFGNPWSTTVESDSGILSVEQPKFENGLVTDESVTENNSFAEFYSDKHGECLKLPPAALTGSNLNDLNPGDAIRIRTDYLNPGETNTSKWTDHIASKGTTFYVRNVGQHPEDSKYKILLSRRRDSSCRTFRGGKGEYYPIRSQSLETFAVRNGGSFPKIIVEKLTLDSNLFSVKLKPAILLKQKPNFQDAYALLRVSASKQNQRNALMRTIGADFPGVDTVGHDSFDAKRIFTNYIRYGSAVNIYGSSVVPAQRMKVSGSPLYESIRKFVSSYMRVADRHDLINYTVEGGKGVLYFRRFNRFLAKKTKATVLKHMEPSVEPVGVFYEGSKGKGDLNTISHANYKPIVDGENYFVYSPYTTSGSTLNEEGYLTSETQKVKYPNAQGTDVSMRHKALFTGNDAQSYVSNGSDLSNKYNDVGAYEIEGILSESKVKNKSNFPHYSNEWIMFLNGVHYHPSNSHIYKPSVYGDIMGFLNNRCHHRSVQYERLQGPRYDTIRQELLRVPTNARNTPGPRLHVFLSKSSNNMNYIFNTNSPDNGNLDIYGVEDYVQAYRSACPPVTPKPYKVRSCRVVDSNYNDLLSNTDINPSFRKPYGRSTPSGGVYRPPANIIRVELDRPLSGSGRLFVDRNGWMGVDKEQLKDESYRTDENTILEYLMHNYLGRSGYHCKRMMIGDYAADTNVHEGIGYRPFGACFPRFYFLKLIPYVGKGARLDTDPYAQMDFYIRAMSGEFLKPYIDGPLGKPNSWSNKELLSRSSEEDHTAYYYVDPREINNS